MVDDNTNKSDQLSSVGVIDDRLMIAIITEGGQVAWVACNEPSIEQQKQFQKIFVVTNNPSYVVSFILFIEIAILKLLSRFEKTNKGDRNG